MRISGSNGALPLWALTGANAANGAGTAGATGSKTTGPGSDELTLSAEALQLADELGGLPKLPGTRADGSIHIEDIRERTKHNMADLQSRLDSLFITNNIDTSTPVQLQMGADGQLFVANDHPQKAEIEKLLTTNPAIRTRFAQISSDTTMVKAADEAVAFQAAYRRNPQAALAQFAHLFDADRPQPTVSIKIGGPEGFQLEVK